MLDFGEEFGPAKDRGVAAPGDENVAQGPVSQPTTVIVPENSPEGTRGGPVAAHPGSSLPDGMIWAMGPDGIMWPSIDWAAKERKEREARLSRLRDYIRFVLNPDDESIVFASAEEANFAGALLAAVRGGQGLDKHPFAYNRGLGGAPMGHVDNYGPVEYIWGIRKVPGGFRPTRPNTGNHPIFAFHEDNPEIMAAIDDKTLVGIGHTHTRTSSRPRSFSRSDMHRRFELAEDTMNPNFKYFLTYDGTSYVYDGTGPQQEVTSVPGSHDFEFLVRYLRERVGGQP